MPLKIFLFILLTSLAQLGPSNGLARQSKCLEPIAPFVAEYTVAIDGDQVGQARLELASRGAEQFAEFDLEATKGLASLVGYRHVQSNRFRWHNNRIAPIHFDEEKSYLLKEKKSSVNFSKDRVSGRKDGKSWELPVGSDQIDPLGLILTAMQFAKSDHTASANYRVINRGRARPVEMVFTDGGAGSDNTVQIVQRRLDKALSTRSTHDLSRQGVATTIASQEDGRKLLLTLKRYEQRQCH